VHPVFNAIVWQDRRTFRRHRRPLARRRRTARARAHRAPARPVLLGDEDRLDPRQRAGCPRPRRARRSGVRQPSTRGSSGSSRRVESTPADATNASRTLLLDIERGTWDPEMLDLFGIPECLLPKVVPSSDSSADEPRAVRRPRSPSPRLWRPASVARGQRRIWPRRRESHLRHRGVRAHALRHDAPALRDARRDVAAQIGAALEYALEGSIFMGGAVVQWIVEGLKLARTRLPRKRSPRACPTATASSWCPRSPAWALPEWDPLARARSSAHARRHERARGPRGHGVHPAAGRGPCAGDGRGFGAWPDGAARRRRRDRELARHADARRRLEIPVHTAAMAESTALGVAYLAGLATGVWRSPDDLEMLRAIGRTYEPDPAATARLADLRVRWAEAVRRSLSVERE